MKLRTFCAAICCAVALGWVSAKGFSDDDADDGMKKLMEELAKPGPEHDALKRLAGKWAIDGKFWMDPAKPPTESKSTATSTLLLGGRYLRQEVKGEMMGETFEGIGYTGFDKVMGKYVNVWMDNMGTGMMAATGECSGDKKVMTFSGTHDMGMGGPTAFREVLTFKSDTEHVMEMYMTMEGNEMKVMELTYRKQ